jgi:hypothetical protein
MNNRNKKRKKKSNKIDVVEYSLMHDRKKVLDLIRELGYKGKADVHEMYNAIMKLKRKHKKVALNLFAEMHPDRQLILSTVEDSLLADGSKKEEDVILPTFDDDTEEKGASVQETPFKIDATSIMIGVGVALVLVIAIKSIR